MKVVVATRNPGKVRELREILASVGDVELLGLGEVGVAESSDEDAVEVYETFAENALAKARYYAERAGMPVIADDSGICVDALGGRPGVRSRRFAPDAPVRGQSQDDANNAFLLELLGEEPEERRRATYRCAIAYAEPGGEAFVVEGECAGRILPAPRGVGGFGYDPLFYLDAEGCTFGELPAARKHAVSHRGIAARLAAERLAALRRVGQTDGAPPPLD